VTFLIFFLFSIRNDLSSIFFSTVLFLMLTIFFFCDIQCINLCLVLTLLELGKMFPHPLSLKLCIFLRCFFMT